MTSPVKSLEELVNHAAARQRRFVSGSAFSAMSREDALQDPRKRAVILACARRFSINFQTLLFTRQALCADPKFYSVFLHHLNEELGHDKLLAGENVPAPIDDTLFEALIAWFNYQMVILDNAERTALMHLVLEAAGDQFHVLAAPHLRDKVRSGYFDLHSELDADHAHMGVDLLKDLGAETYRRLALIVDRGWDMMESTFERVRQLAAEPK